jgi:Ca2+-binding EF-hand superfamily protein
MKTILLSTAAALLFALPASAQDDCVVGGVGEDFSRYDTNNDCALDAAEFTTALEANPEYVARYDTNDDGIITEDEFGDPDFAEYDRDEDALIDVDEFALFEDATMQRADDPALEERGVERAGSERGGDIVDAVQPEQDVIE